MTHRLAVLLALLFILLPLVAWAEEASVEGAKGPVAPSATPELAPTPGAAAPQDEREEHNSKGLFIRMAVGGGYLGYRSSGGLDGGDGHTTTPARVNTLGLALATSFGRTVRENLAAHFDFTFRTAPILQTFPYYDSKEYTIRMRLYDAFLGAGVTYYVIPSNLFIGASLGFDLYPSMIGVGGSAQVMLGKEWQVSKEWGLGMALMGHIGAAVPLVMGSHFLLGSTTLLFTSTYH